MATHELYIGGPANTSLPVGQMFPKPTFSNAVPSAVAGHRGSAVFSLTRDLHFDKTREGGPSVLQYFDNNTVVVGDRLGLVIIPAKTILLAIHVDVVGTASGVQFTLALRNGNDFPNNSYHMDVVNSFVLNAYGEVIGDAYGSGDMYSADGCCPRYFEQSNMLDLIIVSTPGNNEIAGTFTRDTRIRISPIVINPLAGTP
jgi:hypothetical protein